MYITILGQKNKGWPKLHVNYLPRWSREIQRPRNTCFRAADQKISPKTHKKWKCNDFSLNIPFINVIYNTDKQLVDFFYWPTLTQNIVLAVDLIANLTSDSESWDFFYMGIYILKYTGLFIGKEHFFIFWYKSVKS